MVFPILIRWHLYIESPPSPPPPLPNHPSSSNNNTTNSSGININIIIRSCSNVCPGGNDIRNWSMPGRTEPPSTAGIPGRNISAVANHDTRIKMPLCVYSRTVWIFTPHLHIQWSHSRNKDNRKDRKKALWLRQIYFSMQGDIPRWNWISWRRFVVISQLKVG